jgi:hypothetical protein
LEARKLLSRYISLRLSIIKPFKVVKLCVFKFEIVTNIKLNKISNQFHIGIGCRRCASSFVHRFLDDHPDIHKKKNGGLHYFTSNYDNGIKWYLNQFETNNNNVVHVDFSVSYSYPEALTQTIHRIKNTIDNPKLFMVVRNPIERAFSDYLRSIRLSEYPKKLSFINSCNEYPELLKRGLYANTLIEYKKLLPKAKIKVFFYDDLLSDEQKFKQSILRYFGVLPLDFKSYSSNKEMKGASIRFERLNNYMLRTKLTIDQQFINLGFNDAWSNIKKIFLPFWHKILTYNQSPVTLSSKERQYLIPYFKSDIQLLEKIETRNLRNWYT